MVELSFEYLISFKLMPYVQYAENLCVELMVGDKMREFESQIYLIANDEKLKNSFANLVKQKCSGQKLIFTPYNNRYLRAMAYLGWIPSFFNNKKLSELINYIGCESPRDISLPLLQRLIK